MEFDRGRRKEGTPQRPVSTALEMYAIRPGDERVFDAARASIGRILAQPPKGFQFEFADSELFSKPPCGDEVVFVFGRTLDEIRGYARCHERSPSPDISAISTLYELDRPAGEVLVDSSKRHVTRDRLTEFAGYSDYTGQGPVLHIGLIETFQKGCGEGSDFLRMLKGLGYELIELEANGPEPARFFEKNGFLRSGIEDQEGFPIMVWHNPQFR